MHRHFYLFRPFFLYLTRPVCQDIVFTIYSIDEHPVSISILDTLANEGFEHIWRPMSYKSPPADVFLLCFSIAHKETFDNIAIQWEPEVFHHCPGAQLVLVGLQSDLRDGAAEYYMVDKEPTFQGTRRQGRKGKRVIVESKQGEELASNLGRPSQEGLPPRLVKYVECCVQDEKTIESVLNAVSGFSFQEPMLAISQK